MNRKEQGGLLCRRQVRYKQLSNLGWGFSHTALIIKSPFLFSFCSIFFLRKGGDKIREKCQKTFSTISKNREPLFLSRQYEFWMNYFFQFSTPIKIFFLCKSHHIRTLIFQIEYPSSPFPPLVSSHQRTGGCLLLLRTVSANHKRALLIVVCGEELHEYPSLSTVGWTKISLNINTTGIHKRNFEKF